MSDISDQIQSLALFGKFNNKQLEYLVEESNTVTLSEDEQIFEQDDESDDCFYVVLAGSIGIEKLMRDEKEIVTTMKPGEFFGELGLFSGGKRRAGAVALESSQLLEITRKSVGKMKAEHPEALISMYEEMFESLAGRFDALAQKAEKTQFWL